MRLRVRRFEFTILLGFLFTALFAVLLLYGITNRVQPSEYWYATLGAGLLGVASVLGGIVLGLYEGE